MILTQNHNFVKFGPKTEIFSSFYEIWNSGHFKISFNKVINLIEGLRNVKTLKSFFTRGVIRSFFEENMFKLVLNMPLYFEMWSHK